MNVVHVYCPICGNKILYNSRVYKEARHHKEFGVVCNATCMATAELKYARMIAPDSAPVIEAQRNAIRVAAADIHSWAVHQMAELDHILADFDGIEAQQKKAEEKE